MGMRDAHLLRIASVCSASGTPRLTSRVLFPAASQSAADFYKGKKLCYVYKAKTKKKGTTYRTSWGKVTRVHGTSGVVRAKFKNNLPPSSMGGKIRCMLYPSTI